MSMFSYYSLGLLSSSPRKNKMNKSKEGGGQWRGERFRRARSADHLEARVGKGAPEDLFPAVRHWKGCPFQDLFDARFWLSQLRCLLLEQKHFPACFQLCSISSTIPESCHVSRRLHLFCATSWKANPKIPRLLGRRKNNVNTAREFTKSFEEKGDSKSLPTLVNNVASLRAEVLS